MLLGLLWLLRVVRVIRVIQGRETLRYACLPSILVITIIMLHILLTLMILKNPASPRKFADNRDNLYLSYARRRQ